MTNLKSKIIPSTLALILCAVALAPAQARAATAAEIDAASRNALRDLYASNKVARELGHHANAVLVFPSIVKGGFIVAAQHGEGALITATSTAGYFRTVAASYGLQAGLQKFGYAIFFFGDGAMTHLHDHNGWELGSAPSLVLVDQGFAKSFSTTNLNKSAYVFFFNQKGLMGGIGIQGSKITEIHPR